jgi:hypothetical protein
MTLPNVENPNLEGAGENQSPVSPEQGKSIDGKPQSSQEFLELKQGYARLEKELKGLQSRQDKSTNEVQRFMEDVKGQMAKGLSLDEAEQAVHANRKAAEKDELLYQIATKLGIGNSPQSVTGNNQKAADEAASVFSEYSINPNDPEAIPLLELRGTDLVKAVSKLAIKRAKQSTPDSSEAPSLSSGAPKPVGIGGLTEQYQKDMLAARGKPSLLKDIKEKARKAGVPVDSIAFV